jgi:hypothetical protein
MKRGLDRVMLKNLHCQKPLPGNGWRRYNRLEKGLMGAVVICGD